MKERRLKTRTHYIHRLRYTTQERIAGAFVLIAIGALVWLLFNHSKSIIVFEEYITIYGRLETVQPINKDTEVIIGGLSAGSIKDVSITDDNRVIITMKILERYSKLLRSDSVARLNTFNVALIDKSIIEISVGSPEMEQLEDGSSIKIVESVNIRALMADIKPALESLINTINRADDILTAIEPDKLADTLENVDAIVDVIEPRQIGAMLDDVTSMSKDMKVVSRNMAMVSGELVTVMSQINAGRGVAGSVLYDEKMEREIRQVSDHMARISVSMEKLISLLNRELENLPELMEKIEPLVQEADETLKATQRIWPLSNAIEEEPDAEKLTPQVPAND